MIVKKIAEPESIKKYLKELNVDSGGVEIISQKSKLLFIEIKNLKTPAVNILKQDALSIGAELAVPSGVILCQKEFYDCLLIGTKREIKKLAKKELAQPFGLKNVAEKLKSLVKECNKPLRIMAILNINNDSFFSGSRFIGKEAIKKIEEKISLGADIIDIGAVSSRPGSKSVNDKEELDRLKDIFKTIKDNKLYEKTLFSIDSYSPLVIKEALKSGFKIVNDITGARDDEIIKLTKKYNAKLIIMHMQGTPKTMQQNPEYSCVVTEVDEFFKKQIEKCKKLGLKKDSIILDVGIGFGKTLEHNIELLKAHEHFCRHGCEVLIGASRKSIIDNITPTPTENRLPGTLAIHIKAVERGASIVRCHDVKEHIQAFKVLNEIS